MRYVMLDRITLLEPPKLAKAYKCISLADDVFVDHFPGYPVMPGALLLESLAQLGAILIEAAMRQRDRNDLFAILTFVDRTKFRHPVVPGDRLELEAQVLRVNEDGGQVRGLIHRDGKRVAEAELGFAFIQLRERRFFERHQEVLNV